MRKLLKLRQWLTIDEAARHLTIVLGEDVTAADVFRLGLDGHLTLSVDFVNHTKAYLGRVIPYRDVPTREVPSIGLRTTPDSVPIRVPEGYLIDDVDELTPDSRFVCFDSTPVTISGVWDLAMLGAERIDIEHKFQCLTDGPSVELINIDGTFVEGVDGQWAQLLAQFKERVVDTPNGKMTFPSSYYPAGALPDDAPLVVRTEALAQFQAKLADHQDDGPRRDREISTRERDTLLKLVIGMAIEAYKHEPGAARSAAPGEIAGDLCKLGMSITDDTVRKYLKEAASTVLPREERKP